MNNSRRSFLGKGLAITSALALTGFDTKSSTQFKLSDDEVYLIGPKTGYKPMIGTLVSMLENMTFQLKDTIKDLTEKELDHQFDDKANTIGALILHIISSEKFHQIETFYERPMNEEEMNIWAPARNLGDKLSKTIKGHDVNHYITIMDEVREESLEGLKTRDDEWLLDLDPIDATEEMPVNRFYRWFHACEHMSNHRGQIKFLMSRLPKK